MTTDKSAAAVHAIQLDTGAYSWQQCKGTQTLTPFYNSLALNYVNINYESFLKFKLIPAQALSWKEMSELFIQLQLILFGNVYGDTGVDTSCSWMATVIAFTDVWKFQTFIILICLN